MRVFVLEHVINHNGDHVVAFIGSTEEKCHEFMINNKDFSDRDSNWHWNRYSEEIDIDIFNDERKFGDELVWFDMDGNAIEEIKD